MSNSVLPELIEPYKLADRSGVLSGEITQSSFARLSELLVNTEGSVTMTLHFARDEEGYRCIKGEFYTEVVMPCERCLEPVTMPVVGEFNVALAMSESQVPSIPKHYDSWVVAPDTQVSWRELVEDEILLALPQFPSHVDPVCEIQTSFGEEIVESESETKRSNPFDVLAGLKSQQ